MDILRVASIPALPSRDPPLQGTADVYVIVLGAPSFGSPGVSIASVATAHFPLTANSDPVVVDVFASIITGDNQSPTSNA